MSVPDRFDVVSEIDQAFPHLVRTNTRSTVQEFLWRVVAALAADDPRWGFLSKQPAENHVEIPGVGRVAIDAIAYEGAAEVVDILGSAGDGPGTGRITWGPTIDRRPSSVWVRAVPYPGGGAGSGSEDPGVGTGGELAALRAEVAELRALVKAAVKIGDKIGLRAQSNGQLLCADLNQGARVIANRDDLGSWETFVVVRG